MELSNCNVQIGYKEFDNRAIEPTKAYPHDAAFDLYALEDEVLRFGTPVKLRTGVAFEMPQSIHGLIIDRSSMGAKGIHVFGGLADSNYRGEIFVVLNNLNYNTPEYEVKKGDKIAQIMFIQTPPSLLVKKDELIATERENKGFGSSGR